MPYSAGYAIADIASLKALSASDLVDGYARWVVSKNTWYGWNANSTLIANDETIISINSAPNSGRFIAAPFLEKTVNLTSGANIPVNGSLSNKFAILLTTNGKLANPTNLKDTDYTFLRAGRSFPITGSRGA